MYCLAKGADTTVAPLHGGGAVGELLLLLLLLLLLQQPLPAPTPTLAGWGDSDVFVMYCLAKTSETGLASALAATDAAAGKGSGS
jgi:hypothetical protein